MKLDKFNSGIASNILKAPIETQDPLLIAEMVRERTDRTAHTIMEIGDRVETDEDASDTCFDIIPIPCCASFCGAAVVAALAMSIFGFWKSIS